MNWYRFKIELSAWMSKTVLCVLTSMIAVSTLFEPAGSIKGYPLSWRVVAENEWMFPVGMTIGVLVLWVCYWQTFRILRADKRYGDR